MFLTTTMILTIAGSISYDNRSLSGDFMHRDQVVTAQTNTNLNLTSQSTQLNNSLLFNSVSVKIDNSNLSEITNYLLRDLALENILNETYDSFMYFINLLPKSITSKLTIDDITVSEYRTISIDFFTQNKNLFSIEFGKDDIGYFTEVNNQLHSLCESTKTDQKEPSIELINFLKSF
ncbi:hypothetical protein ACPDHD_11835 [Myroides odoratimimus]|uniref:hypothetical protein n=1 Tax=Myroides odoratimimus TaxID=76832 RepID=UPI003D2F19B5